MKTALPTQLDAIGCQAAIFLFLLNTKKLPLNPLGYEKIATLLYS